MFERFLPPGKKGTDDDDNDKDEEEKTPIAPLGYERVFCPDYSSIKGKVIYDSSLHSLTQLQEGENKNVSRVR
ncbi:hypothetical protein PVK06_048349 [Gossypium arboreum]|uniref:Uncharacterized protein n=1 Tax=Gossypium arboreum TaxID=29729 RepID=A0ABR0MFQ3_GOSAR|nr:hypothetical protein PVK06_048349 [Gossypium arboreum]